MQAAAKPPIPIAPFLPRPIDIRHGCGTARNFNTYKITSKGRSDEPFSTYSRKTQIPPVVEKHRSTLPDIGGPPVELLEVGVVAILACLTGGSDHVKGDDRNRIFTRIAIPTVCVPLRWLVLADLAVSAPCNSSSCTILPSRAVLAYIGCCCTGWFKIVQMQAAAKPPIPIAPFLPRPIDIRHGCGTARNFNTYTTTSKGRSDGPISIYKAVVEKLRSTLPDIGGPPVELLEVGVVAIPACLTGGSDHVKGED